MDTPFEESNLAHIGSDEDKAAREAAAKLEMNWEGCGQAEGIEIWRVENKRDENGNPDFGIEVWPKKDYGDFYRGDSYIVLRTQKDADEGGFLWDIYFWIGSESSQDEYGVAAYKANELDDLLGDAPVQHRETEGYESMEFLDLFPKGVKYLEGGIASGFRTIKEGDSDVKLPTRLFQVRRCAGRNQPARSYGNPVSTASLNDGDAFVLDTGDKIYTWYGSESSPFEKQKAANVASSMVESRHGHATLITDVASSSDEDQIAFFEALGGSPSDTIAPASSVTDDDVQGEEKKTSMYILSDNDSHLEVTQVETPSKSQLATEAVAMMDIGTHIVIWIGKGSSKREQSQVMCMVGTYLKNQQRQKNTRVTRVLEGQERRCGIWSKVF